MVVKYYLTKPYAESKLRLVCTYSRNQQLKFTTEHLLHPDFWDSKNQRVDESMNGADELNLLLQQFKLDVLKHVRELQLLGINWTELKDLLYNYLKTGSTVTSKEIQNHKYLRVGLVSLFDCFLAAKSADYKIGTVHKYNVLKSILLEFEKHRKKKIKLADVSYPLMEEFRLYMLNVRQNRNDTVYIKLAGLKCIFRWLIKNNYPIDEKALEVRQTVKTKHNIVTLSDHELLQIALANVEPHQIPIRDCFLFQVYTGQRYSDMQQLCPEQIQGDVWKFQSVKTGKDMHVPFVGWSKNAWDIGVKYNFVLPKFSQQYFNREISNICRIASITEIVLLKRYRGNTTIQIRKPKCDLISSHTARRTCVSLLLEKGVPPTVVMKLTGHTSIQTLMKYERTSNEALFNALSGL
ncbi:MAG: tyrosine-type recombinase/integrase [Bacteroidetes bacterium]|nr:tyrosine-type recombinase/integrase [Bacteroidota bacterium]